ncbi:MAG: hypothetical protein U1F60_10865 [Planctomycetota bacterium]
MLLRVRIVPLALAPLLAAALALPSRTTHSTPRLDARVLEVAFDVRRPEVVDEAAAAATRDVEARRSALEGHERTIRAPRVDAPQQSVRATVWRSIDALEDASLALDGQDAAKAYAAAFDGDSRPPLCFRLLREQSYAEAPCGHLEVVVFRTRPGVTREANLKKFDAAEAEFRAGEGLLGHALGIAPDGRWVHVLHWASAEAYTKTGKALFGKPGVGGWIRSLDFQRFEVSRGDVAGR